MKVADRLVALRAEIDALEQVACRCGHRYRRHVNGGVCAGADYRNWRCDCVRFVDADRQLEHVEQDEVLV